MLVILQNCHMLVATIKESPDVKYSLYDPKIPHTYLSTQNTVYNYNNPVF